MSLLHQNCINHKINLYHQHNSLNVNCEANSDGDGVGSGWSNPFFEPVVPWRRSSRQYQHKTRRIHSFRKKFSSRHQQTTDYNNSDNYNDDRICIKSPLDIRASQSTGDLVLFILDVFLCSFFWRVSSLFLFHLIF